MTFHQVEYLNIGAFPESHFCIILRWNEKKRIVPIWIDARDAAAYKQRREQPAPRRPRLGEVLIEAVTRSAGGFQELRIVSYYRGDFIATLVTHDGTELDCRPIDGLSIATSLNLPIFVDETVLAQASVYVSDADLRHWLDIDFSDDDAPTPLTDSASGDSEADDDFSQMMHSMGVSESDLFGGMDDFPDSDDDVTKND